MSPSLFAPTPIGDLALPGRIVMAPLTRSRAAPGNVPADMAVEYYRQRAGAALIITEATQISRQGQGYAWTPGIHTAEQIAGRPFIANPDLPIRLALDSPLNEPDPASFFVGDERGYIDYPALAQAVLQEAP